MDIKNLTGLEKPLTKLIEVVAQGIGETTNTIFELDIKKIKRVGNAEAENEKLKIIKKAEGQAEALSILSRAGNRFALEQYSKQVNLENIFVKTRDELQGSEVSDAPVDKDWTFKFLNIAQDISREDMQELLSKILAGEIKQPNTFSLRTLDFVKNLNKNEIDLFRKCRPYLCLYTYLFLTKSNANEGFFKLSYADVMNLIEFGFIQPTMNTVLKVETAEDRRKIFQFNDGYYNFELNGTTTVELPILQLTTVAYEIAPHVPNIQNHEELFNQYFDELKIFWETKNLKFINKTIR